MKRTFVFDLDGTIADLYNVPNWLDMIRAFDTRPYTIAKPMLNFRVLARYLNKARKKGAKLIVVSWGSMESNDEFDNATEVAKRAWLEAHLPSVEWDEIHVVPYGTPKHEVCGDVDYNCILFDDNEKIRDEWDNAGGFAMSPRFILDALSSYVRCRV